jgi:hypothetical protein
MTVCYGGTVLIGEKSMHDVVKTTRCQPYMLPLLQKIQSVIYDPALRKSNYHSNWLTPPI